MNLSHPLIGLNMDSKTNIQELKEIVKNFCEERDWDQFHGAKELAVALIIESAELLERFRFKSEKEVEELFKDAGKKEQITSEMADVLYFLLRLAQKYDIDLTTELKKKMENNEKRYPVEKFRGSNKKYSEFV
jgi:NTP pyrophosphatase (non-canonical NTP hydrolase)